MGRLCCKEKNNRMINFPEDRLEQEVYMLKIKEMPVYERPYEKLEKDGANRLSE